MPDFSTLAPVAVAILGFIVLFVLFTLRKEMRAIKGAREGDQSFLMLNQSLQGLQERLDRTSSAVNERLDRAAQAFGALGKELSTVQEIGRGLKDFQEFLSSPKLRGNIGEHILNDTLEKVFPKDHFEIQHKFRDGQTVDAIIKTEKGIIPIDAKFPMEQFRKMLQPESEDARAGALREFTRAVKKHIDDISEKYILPEEGTIDFAVMYVPSEQVYYEIITHDEDLMQYAHDQKILLVSPNSFFHFLRVILMGLERAKMAEEATRVWELLTGLQHDFGKFGESMGLVSRHLTNAKNAADSAQGEYGRLAGKLDQVRLLK